MRNLIRLGLFIFVRTALALAIAAWIVSQWWVLECTISFGGSGFCSMNLLPKGWMVDGSNIVLKEDTLNVTQVHLMDGMDWPFADPMATTPTPDSNFQTAGVAYGDFGIWTYASFRHGTVVTLVLLSYFVLKRVYRRDPHLSLPVFDVEDSEN